MDLFREVLEIDSDTLLEGDDAMEKIRAARAAKLAKIRARMKKRNVGSSAAKPVAASSWGAFQAKKESKMFEDMTDSISEKFFGIGLDPPKKTPAQQKLYDKTKKELVDSANKKWEEKQRKKKDAIIAKKRSKETKWTLIGGREKKYQKKI